MTINNVSLFDETITYTSRCVRRIKNRIVHITVYLYLFHKQFPTRNSPAIEVHTIAGKFPRRWIAFHSPRKRQLVLEPPQRNEDNRITNYIDLISQVRPLQVPTRDSYFITTNCSTSTAPPRTTGCLIKPSEFRVLGQRTSRPAFRRAVQTTNGLITKPMQSRSEKSGRHTEINWIKTGGRPKCARRSMRATIGQSNFSACKCSIGFLYEINKRETGNM